MITSEKFNKSANNLLERLLTGGKVCGGGRNILFLSIILILSINKRSKLIVKN